MFEGLRANEIRHHIDAAIEWRRSHSRATEPLHLELIGRHYRLDECPETHSNENFAHEYITNVLPTFAAGIPRIKAGTRKPETMGEQVRAVRNAVNQWIRDTDLRSTNIECAMDALLDGPAFMQLIMEPVPDEPEENGVYPLRPRLIRRAYRDMFWDPEAPTFKSAAFIGHVWLERKAVLKKATAIDEETGKLKPAFNKLALNLLGECDDWRDDEDDFTAKPKSRPHRGMVLGCDVWCRETGMIYTLALGQGREGASEFLRKPRKAFCPPDGPYYMLGRFQVPPDRSIPLSPLVAIKDLSDEISDHSAQIQDDADMMKQLVLVDGSDPALVDAVESGDNYQVVITPGGPQAASVLAIGGPNMAQVNYVELLRGRHDRASGLTDFMRGQLSGDATATEATLASASGNRRMRWMQMMWRNDLMDAIRGAVWMMLESPFVAFVVPMPQSELRSLGKIEHQADPTGGPALIEVTFRGGTLEDDGDGEDGQAGPPPPKLTLSDLEMEIIPMSVELQDQDVLRAQTQEWMGIVTQVGQMAPGMPWVKWGLILDDLAQTYAIPDGAKYLDMQALQTLWQSQGMEGLAGQPHNSEPTLERGGLGGMRLGQPVSGGMLGGQGPTGRIRSGMPGPSQPAQPGASPMQGGQPREQQPQGPRRPGGRQQRMTAGTGGQMREQAANRSRAGY